MEHHHHSRTDFYDTLWHDHDPADHYQSVHDDYGGHNDYHLDPCSAVCPFRFAGRSVSNRRDTGSNMVAATAKETTR